ncbi:3-oxoacyl-[acyl-carrier-protein] synthase III C-terminal domain-containing protein [Paenibacillus sp. An7]|uniref:3-oxoacyl-[acyl-carrier-protein] synthase III C-terminal domain-containing protein n=1 Tax=Paenibacillus sp. An7 TaxID=2689577 RepID=UPI00135C81E2|nr:3-oxoacyl-[acyl-carrier-protein] synthase III C-terminal domain-containing protein [Paenibacillus sp. An7]
MGLAIKDIIVCLPERIESPSSLLEDQGYSKGEMHLLSKYHRLKGIPIREERQTLDQSLIECVQILKKKQSLDQVDVVLYAHSSHVQVPGDYGLMYNVLSHFGMEHLPSYGISQLNCASSIAAMDLAKRMTECQPEIRQILLLCADQFNFLPNSWRYIRKSTVLGDSAVALLLENGGERNVIQSVNIINDTRFHAGYYATEEEMGKFNQNYVSNIISGMEATARACGMELADLDYILPHNVNWTTWKEFLHRTGFDKERIYLDMISRIGHTFSNDAMINLSEAMTRGWLEKGSKFMLTSIGLGSFFGFALLKH